jgi:uncharacterized membrane protein YhaH (DUF805 family)
MVFCHSCGQGVETDWNVCPFCSSPLIAPTPEVEVESPVSPSPVQASTESESPEQPSTESESPEQPSTEYESPVQPSPEYESPVQNFNEYASPVQPSPEYGSPVQNYNQYTPPVQPSNEYGQGMVIVSGRPTNMMNPIDSVITCFQKYVGFEGRASRSEYWWFFLAIQILYIPMAIIDVLIGVLVFSSLLNLAIFLPSLAAGIRRMHDHGKSGWYCLIPIYNLILFATEGEAVPNIYGPVPTNIREGNSGTPDVFVQQPMQQQYQQPMQQQYQQPMQQQYQQPMQQQFQQPMQQQNQQPMQQEYQKPPPGP